MELPAITIDDYELDVVEQFTYLGSAITDNLSLDTEIDKRIGKAATTRTRLTSRVWTNRKLTVKTNMVMYNTEVLSRVNLPNMFTLHRQRMSTAWRMAASQKTFFMESWHLGTKGRLQLHYKDVCRRNMKGLDINTESWKGLAANLMRWRSTLNQHLKSRKENLVNTDAGKMAHRKKRNISNRPQTTHKCDLCKRDCFSHIDLYSKKRLYNNQTDRTTRMYTLDQTHQT